MDILLGDAPRITNRIREGVDEACLDRGMRLEVHLARAENEFLAESVTFADSDRRWERSFTRKEASIPAAHHDRAAIARELVGEVPGHS